MAWEAIDELAVEVLRAGNAPALGVVEPGALVQVADVDATGHIAGMVAEVYVAKRLPPSESLGDPEAARSAYVLRWYELDLEGWHAMSGSAGPLIGRDRGAIGGAELDSSSLLCLGTTFADDVRVTALRCGGAVSKVTIARVGVSRDVDLEVTGGFIAVVWSQSGIPALVLHPTRHGPITRIAPDDFVALVT